MSNIKEVLYEEIPENIYTKEQAGEFYFHINTVNIDKMFCNGYEEYERENISVRNKVIKEALMRESIDAHPKLNTTIFGISAILNKPIIVVEI